VPRPSAPWLAVVAALALVAGGAVAGGGYGLSWRPLTLPLPAGRQVTVRDVTACPGRWYAVGGTTSSDGSTAPAAWWSPDARRWTALALHPLSLYGRLATLYGAACRGDRVVAIGAAPGGAHGNPRTATWIGGTAGLAEVPAPFDLYGGNDAVTVGRLVAGPPGFLIAGGRVSPRTGLAGAAVWRSPDGRAFTLVDRDPALASSATVATAVIDAAAVPGGWTAVGNVLPAGSPGIARSPAAWYSPDGVQWRREEVPGRRGTDEALDRVVAWHGGALALGERGNRFGTWTRDGIADGGGWATGGSFGTFTGTAQPAVTGLVAGPAGVFAAGCDGSACRLWTSTDGGAWTELRLPVQLPAGGQHRILLAGTGADLLLVANDGQRPRLWLGRAGG
jgi:hypothetical protein